MIVKLLLLIGPAELSVLLSNLNILFSWRPRHVLRGTWDETNPYVLVHVAPFLSHIQWRHCVIRPCSKEARIIFVSQRGGM